MARNEKSSVSNLQNEEHKRILTSLLREEGNRRCADCSSRGPTWASVNLGVFVCLNCSGIHRSLGVHISKVRSTNLDTWLPEQVAFVQAMGNVRCNKYWEANLPRDFHRPPEADMGALRVFITDKYVNKRYAIKGYSESPCIENYTSHPFLVELANGGKNENNDNAAGAVAAGEGTAKAVGAPKAVPAPAVPEFDLLSLDDDHKSAPVSAPQQQQTQQHPTTAATLGAPAAAPTAAALGADWDPFAAIAREPITHLNTQSMNSTSSTTAPSPSPAIVDPFAEIERASSSWSSGTATTTGTTAPSMTMHPSSSSLNNNTITAPAATTIDPFALPPLPPQAAPAAAVVPVKVVQPPPPVISMQMTSSGSLASAAPMRSATNGHSKGNLSHEDILAMFDK